MRVIAGKFGGRHIPEMKGLPVRPTTDRTREGLFNVLHHRIEWEEQRVLDLCSGTGAVSLEFWSRGVAEVISVDRNRKCIQAQKRLFSSFHLDHAQCVMSDALTYLKKNKHPYTLIFIDPPYQLPHQERWIEEGLKEHNLVDGGWLIIEHLSNNSFQHMHGFQFFKTYGSSSISFFCRNF